MTQHNSAKLDRFDQLLPVFDRLTGSFFEIDTIDFWLSDDFWLMPGGEPPNITGVSDKHDKRHENGELNALWVRPIGAAYRYI